MPHVEQMQPAGNSETRTACHEDGWDAEDGHVDGIAGLGIPANLWL